jgi:hypothetical protein
MTNRFTSSDDPQTRTEKYLEQIKGSLSWINFWLFWLVMILAQHVAK